MSKESKNQIPLELFEKQAASFDNFLEGPNSQIVQTLKELAKGQGPQFVYLWGTTGSGKTHLMESLGSIREGVPDFSEEQPVYLVDNVQSLNEQDQQKLFNLYNSVRATQNTHLVVTADRSPSDFKAIGWRDDLTSRFAWGVVFELLPLNEHDRRHEVLKLAASRGIPVSEEVLNWMDNNLPRDMHTLTTLLENLDRYALSTKRSITIPLIKEWLDSHPLETPNEIRLF